MSLLQHHVATISSELGYTVIYAWFYYFLWLIVKFGLNIIAGFCELVKWLFHVTTITHWLALDVTKVLWLVGILILFMIGYGVCQTKYYSKVMVHQHMFSWLGNKCAMLFTLLVALPIFLLLMTLSCL